MRCRVPKATPIECVPEKSLLAGGRGGVILRRIIKKLFKQLLKFLNFAARKKLFKFFLRKFGHEKGVFSRDAVLVLAACFCFMSCHTMIIPVLAGFTGSLGGSSLLMGTIVGITNLFR